MPTLAQLLSQQAVPETVTVVSGTYLATVDGLMEVTLASGDVVRAMRLSHVPDTPTGRLLVLCGQGGAYVLGQITTTTRDET